MWSLLLRGDIPKRGNCHFCVFFFSYCHLLTQDYIFMVFFCFLSVFSALLVWHNMFLESSVKARHTPERSNCHFCVFSCYCPLLHSGLYFHGILLFFFFFACFLFYWSDITCIYVGMSCSGNVNFFFSFFLSCSTQEYIFMVFSRFCVFSALLIWYNMYFGGSVGNVKTSVLIFKSMCVRGVWRERFRSRMGLQM